MLTGMDARAANITSTIALFPAQLVTGLTVRKSAARTGSLSLGALMGISLMGGAIGAVLLLVTPSDFFAAHGALAGAVRHRAVRLWQLHAPQAGARRGWAAMARLWRNSCIAIYGGYFGGGIGFLMLAALSSAGLAIRAAGGTKNVLAALMNASAVAIFIFSPQVHWLQAGVVCAGSVGGGYAGGLMVNRVNEKALRIVVALIGIALTVGLFVRAYQGG